MKPLPPALRPVLVTLGLAGVNLLPAASPPGLVLSHPGFTLTVTPATGAFTLQSRAGHGPWSLAGRVTAGGGEGRVEPLQDSRWGAGEQLTLSRADGTAARLRVFPNLPFVLLDATLANPTREPQTLNRVTLATVTADLGVPAARLTTLGTGGLLPADRQPGSYTWLAVADPATRRGVVAAWLTHDRASGVLFPAAAPNGVGVEARTDFGRLPLAPGATAGTETLALGGFAETCLGLEAWADAVARHYAIRLPPQPTGYCTWYSDRNRGAGSEATLPELAAFAAARLRPYGFTFIQIDDGWQDGDARGAKEKKNGPHKNFTRHRANGPYPSGMAPIAARLSALGFTPGLWLMPFAGTFDDPWFADKQEWLVRRADGSPFDMPWGGTGLDLTHPGARDYLRTFVARLTRDWGYRYLKLDGLYTGLPANPRYINAGYKEDDFGDAVHHRPEIPPVAAYRSGLQLVREAAGPGVFLLGCTMAQNMRTFGASFGLVDAMRVGPDNNATFAAWLRSPVCGSRHYFLHGRVWYNDPDPMYARAGIPDEEARTIATWTGISGQLYANSDWLPDLPPARLDLLRRTIPPHGATARPLDLLDRDPAAIWHVTARRGGVRRDVVAFFNWSAAPATLSCELGRLGLDPTGHHAAFDFWADRFLPPVQGTLTAELPAHGCRVIALRPAEDHPSLLSTSRHVAQAMVEIREERWDAATRTLSGRSEVTAGDGYELRLALPASGALRAPLAVELDEASARAGARAHLLPDAGGLRLRIDVPQPREVTWHLRTAGQP